MSLPVLELLRKVDLFEGLAAPEIESFAALAHEEVYARGKTILREGEPVSKFYVVGAGVVEIGRRGARNGRRRVESGDVFGELALFEELPSSVEVTAAVTPETKLAVWHRFEVQRLMAASPGTALLIARRLFRKIGARLGAMNAVMRAVEEDLG